MYQLISLIKSTLERVLYKFLCGMNCNENNNNFVSIGMKALE